MKRVINLMSIAWAIITSIIIICTFLTSYQFFYIHLIFNSYEPIQISLAITMLLFCIRSFINERGLKKTFYCLLSVSISLSLIYLITMVR